MLGPPVEYCEYCSFNEGQSKGVGKADRVDPGRHDFFWGNMSFRILWFISGWHFNFNFLDDFFCENGFSNFLVNRGHVII